MKKTIIPIVVLLIILFLPDFLVAGTMPWDSGLTKVKDNLTGQTAFFVSLIAVFVTGAGLIFGGQEMGQFAKAMIYIVLVIAIIINASSILTMIGGGSQAGGSLISLAQNSILRC